MGRVLFYLGLFLVALPFAVMGLETLVAHLTHATGERAMAAGFWGVWLAFITLIPGLICMFIGGFIIFFSRD